MRKYRVGLDLSNQINPSPVHHSVWAIKFSNNNNKILYIIIYEISIHMGGPYVYIKTHMFVACDSELFSHRWLLKFVYNSTFSHYKSGEWKKQVTCY